ncbi:hypothetical protein AMS68_000457 [Peltaster fructicola]|uniref:ATP-dependent DNA helicase PIF1 n=1 Tax=Peltaster fructicola TaxID=286661 RepID=A0A6H0XK98_9PEZI|nr:hypothetical protein AMS68_000457 [Peltaster fructicola]
MLRSAVNEYDLKEFGSSSQVSTKQRLDGGPNPSQIFKELKPSDMNMREPVNFRRPTIQQGVKRMSSGLPKTLGKAVFEDEGTSHKIILNSGKARGLIETIEIDENDFESDVDLDYEPARAVTYPTLPATIDLTQSPSPKAKRRSPGPFSPVVYPTLPRQQAVQTTYHDFDLAPPPSSAVADWSSSPLHHMQPKIETYSHDKVPPPAVARGPPSKPVSRRKIPWSADTSSETNLNKVAATPVSTATAKKPADLWNTTASAVKEQQKKHREEARKGVKKNEGTDESALAAKQKTKRVAKVFLSEEQQHVLDLVVEARESVFFTGSAGTGKSVLMREIIAALRKKYAKEPDRIAVTASTGLAACNVGGVTLHSFSGAGLGKEDVPELVKKIKRNAKAKHRWLRTKVLIIDEVSMVDGDFFDKLESIARQLRNNGRPFGGIQLVITGDFFQLPPVPDRNRTARFAFEASTWTNTVKHTIALHQVFRQKDPVFAGMLNEMREGKMSDASIKAFQNLAKERVYRDEITATELFPLRAEVDRANTERLSKLEGQTFIFEARDGGSVVDKTQRDRLLSNCMAQETIALKKGAQVMLIKNIDENLVNGSIGNVIAFMDDEQFDKFSLNEEDFDQQADGTLASQAMQESKEEKARRRLNDNLTVSRKFPLVRFIIADGTSRDMLCQPEVWKVELPSGEVQASRSQVPLILSWALSIHKAQGQTLERVKVNLSKAFEKGQAYVALSRATSMEGLQVIGFHPSKVMAHDKVVNFYANLARIDVQNGRSVPKKAGQQAQKNLSAYERQYLEDHTNF